MYDAAQNRTLGFSLRPYSLFAVGPADGGSAGAFYGFLFVWLGILVSFVAIGEISSMAPNLYKKYLSYLIGWLIFLSWQGAVASICFLGGSMLQGSILMGNLNFNMQEWQLLLRMIKVSTCNLA